LAAAGASVAVVDVDNSGEQLAQKIRDEGGHARFFKTDVSREDDVRAMVDAVVEHFGKLDGAFNNAGIEQANRPLHDLTIEQWNRAIAVDLTGVFTCLKHEISLNPCVSRTSKGA